MKIQVKYNPEENHMQIDHIGILVNVYIFVWKFFGTFFWDAR